MNNLDFNAMGVSNLTEVEMKNIEGGWANLIWLAIGIIVSECLDRNAGKDFQEGYNAARS